MNKIDLNNRVAVITGGSGGIGLAIAERFIDSGATVVLWDINIEAATAAAGRIKAAAAHQVDVTDPATVEQAARQTRADWGKIEILINSAGITGPSAPVEDYTLEAWKRTLDINLTGVFICCREVVKYMREANYGRIVNLSSIGGKEGNPNQSCYSAAKAGVIAFTKSLAKELADTEIRVNCVAPAAIETELLKQMTSEQLAYVKAKIPMGRLGRVEEVAALVAWMASEECSFTTGAAFDASGGRATY